jgi:hypothetical protein
MAFILASLILVFKLLLNGKHDFEKTGKKKKALPSFQGFFKVEGGRVFGD